MALQNVTEILSKGIYSIKDHFKAANSVQSYFDSFILYLKNFIYYDLLFPLGDLSTNESIDRKVLISFTFYTALFLGICLAYLIYTFFSQKNHNFFNSVFGIAFLPPLVFIFQYAVYFDFPLDSPLFYQRLADFPISPYCLLLIQTFFLLVASIYTIYSTSLVKHKGILSFTQSSVFIIIFSLTSKYLRSLELFKYLHIIMLLLACLYSSYLLAMHLIVNLSTNNSTLNDAIYSNGFKNYSLPNLSNNPKNSTQVKNQSQQSLSSGNYTIEIPYPNGYVSIEPKVFVYETSDLKLSSLADDIFSLIHPNPFLSDRFLRSNRRTHFYFNSNLNSPSNVVYL